VHGREWGGISKTGSQVRILNEFLNSRVPMRPHFIIMNTILDKAHKLDISLYDFQEEVIMELEFCENNRKLLTQPTGTGKTVVFIAYAILTGKRTLIIVHNDELIEQTLKTIKMISPNVKAGKFVGNHRDWDADILVASLQSIKNPHNLVLLDNDFDLVIYDEAHHATSETSKRVLFRFGLCDLDTAGYKNVELFQSHFSDTRELIGVTATPERTDGTPLGKIFHDRIDAPPIEWFIANDYLCDLKFVSIETGVDLSDVRSYMGDLKDSEIAQKLEESGYINELARVINEYCTDRKSIIVYLPNVKTAKLAAKLINESGISADYVIGQERKRRKEVIKKFKSGEIRVLVNCLVLKEGFDAPNADAILICRPTKSPLLLTQMIGRLTRRSPETGKTIGIVYDLVFQRRQEDIISASDIFGDFELAESEKEQLSIKERMDKQIERKALIETLINKLDRIRHQKELVQEENEREQEEARKKKRILKELLESDMPDSVQLLVDTRILNKLDMSYKEFSLEFRNEIQILRLKQKGDDWIDEQAVPKQISELSQLMDYNHEDLSIISWIEAQVLIELFKSSEPITERQLKYLRFKKNRSQDLEKYGIPNDWEIPKTKKAASKLISQLDGIKDKPETDSNSKRNNKNFRSRNTSNRNFRSRNTTNRNFRSRRIKYGKA